MNLSEIEALAGPQRCKTFRRLAELVLEHKLKRIVETGCYRGIPADGQSTKILTLLAKEVGGILDSVDTNPDHIAKASLLVNGGEGVTFFHQSDSVEWLAARTEPVDVLYLDSFDHTIVDPLPCQMHQLRELLAIEEVLAPKCLVLLDDADLPDGGKVRLSGFRLMDTGWLMVCKGYQFLFGRGL